MLDRYCPEVDEHLADEAALVAALSPDDEVRRIANEHAVGCARCREALEEGGALLALLRRTIADDKPPSV